MISCDSLPDIHWFYYCYIVIHRRGDTSPHLLLFYRISWVYRRVSPLLWTIQAHVSQLGVGSRLRAIASYREIENVKMWKCENVKSWCFRQYRNREKVKRWKGEKVKSWCFRQNRNREKVKRWKSEKVKSWCFRQKEKKWKGEIHRWGRRAMELCQILFGTAP